MIELTKITADGGLEVGIVGVSHELEDVIEGTRGLYRDVGYNEPWVGYLALDGDECVGTCAFKAAPVNNMAELAFFTFPSFQNRGFGMQMATKLVEIARSTIPNIVIIAQTLRREDPSTKILRKLGFERTGEIHHEEDGDVWQWTLPSR